MARRPGPAMAAPQGTAARRRVKQLATDNPTDVTVPVAWLDRLRADIQAVADAAAVIARRVDTMTNEETV